MKALCPILSPTASPVQTPTLTPSYLPGMPCFKTRSWSPAKQNWVLCRRKRSKNNTSQTTCTVVLAASMRAIVFLCRQRKTAQLHHPQIVNRC